MMSRLTGAGAALLPFSGFGGMGRDSHQILDVFAVILAGRFGGNPGVLHGVDRLINGVQKDADVLDQHHLSVGSDSFSGGGRVRGVRNGWGVRGVRGVGSGFPLQREL